MIKLECPYLTSDHYAPRKYRDACSSKKTPKVKSGKKYDIDVCSNDRCKSKTYSKCPFYFNENTVVSARSVSCVEVTCPHCKTKFKAKL